MSTTRFDELIHAPTRLAIVSLLFAAYAWPALHNLGTRCRRLSGHQRS